MQYWGLLQKLLGDAALKPVFVACNSNVRQQNKLSEIKPLHGLVSTG